MTDCQGWHHPPFGDRDIASDTHSTHRSYGRRSNGSFLKDVTVLVTYMERSVDGPGTPPDAEINTQFESSSQIKYMTMNSSLWSILNDMLWLNIECEFTLDSRELIMLVETIMTINYNGSNFRMPSSTGEGRHRSPLEPGSSNPYILHDAVY
jgi:hypothetical protein